MVSAFIGTIIAAGTIGGLILGVDTSSLRGDCIGILRGDASGIEGDDTIWGMGTNTIVYKQTYKVV